VSGIWIVFLSTRSHAGSIIAATLNFQPGGNV